MTYRAPVSSSTHLAHLLADAHAKRVAYLRAVSALQAALDAFSSSTPEPVRRPPGQITSVGVPK